MKELKQLGDGRYFAFVGYKKSGSNQQHKFFLGREDSLAIQRIAMIRSLWKHSATIARRWATRLFGLHSSLVPRRR